jgi:predicted DNA-binding protein with PD1-like motif
VRSHDLTLGRTFGVVFDHGEDFFTALAEFCRTNNVRQGYIPSFIAGFSEVEIVGTCDKLDDPAAPVWTKVHLTNVEAFGGGTLAYDPDTDQVHPHIHVAVGLKEQSAIGYTSHLLSAQVLFLTEMLVIEVAGPEMRRERQPDLYNVPLLRFATPHDTGQ